MSIPRELRNMIYSHVVADHRILEAPDNVSCKCPTLILRRSIAAEMLLINHQIHDEYLEHILPRSHLQIKAVADMTLSSYHRDKWFKANARSHLFKQVKKMSDFSYLEQG